jgi:hypothetical protein
MLRHALALVALVAATSCTVGAPPGFSSGDSWTVPLVGPLEDGLLLVPALVNGKGPYVFAIDPDAHVSIVDQDVVKETGVRIGEGPHLLDETDTQQPRYFAEIMDWQLGTLNIKGPKSAQIVPPGTFDAAGRRIHGVLGRDIIADSLVFTFDRDAGVVVLQTTKTAKARPNATAIKYSILRSRIDNAEVLPISRRLVTAKLNGVPFTMHVDFGAAPSQLRPRSWPKAKLAESDLQIVLVDETGMSRDVKKQGIASSVELGGATVNDVSFVPYADRRWLEQDLEGTLGLHFFRRFSVTANWDSQTIYLSPRHDPTTNIVARLGRWQSRTLTSCEHTGCVKVTLIDPLANKPPAPPQTQPDPTAPVPVPAASPSTTPETPSSTPSAPQPPTPAPSSAPRPAQHPGLVASIARDASSIDLPLEVLIAVTPAEGKPPLKWMVVNLPSGTERAMTHLSADYIGATLTVIDASPFPRTCPANGGCVDMLAPPQVITPPDPNAPQTVPPSSLKLVTGDRAITPDDLEKMALSGKTIQLSVKVCADATGAITSAKIIQPSGVVNYDTKVVRKIQNEWRFEPFQMNGKAVPVCTAQTFIYTQQ